MGESECIGIDCAVKPTRSLLGKTHRNTQRKVKESQAIPYADQIHAIQVVRGASGSVLCSEHAFSEKLDAIFNMYREVFSDQQRNSVNFITPDKPGAELVLLARATFPNFRGCALAPIHIVFCADQATWGESRTYQLNYVC